MRNKIVLGVMLAASLTVSAKDPVLMTINSNDVKLSEFEYLYNKNNGTSYNYISEVKAATKVNSKTQYRTMEKAYEKDEIPVGAVIVKDNKIIARQTLQIIFHPTISPDIIPCAVGTIYQQIYNANTAADRTILKMMDILDNVE